MSPKPDLLFLSQTVPYPPNGGPWIRSWHLLRTLASRYSLTMLCFERALPPTAGYRYDEEASLRALGRLGRVEVFRIPERHGRVRFAADHLGSLLTGRVFTHYLYSAGDYRRRLRALLAGRRFELVHVDSLDLVAYLPLLRGQRVACTHHNVESALLRRRARAESSPARRVYARLQASLMDRTEREWCPRVALNIAVSERDADALRALAPEGRYAVVPNGVDVAHFRPATATPGSGLVFVGMATWFPNRDALRYFCGEILPLLRQVRPDLPVSWVGAASARDRARFRERHDVCLTGHVPDVRPWLGAAEVVIVPLRVGGGSRIKILDAWAMAKPVVSTSVGCEGLDARPGENILVADSPAEFAAAVQRLLDDPDLARRLGAAGRATAERDHSWEVVGARLLDLYHELRRTPLPPAS